MASLQASTLLLSSSSSSSCSRKINAAIHVPNLPKLNFSVPKISTRKQLGEELNIRQDRFMNTVITTTPIEDRSDKSTTIVTTQLYAILEAVADRVEMHANIGAQRDNWNTLLLNSINMITLTAATMAGIAATGGIGMPLLALKLSSTFYKPKSKPMLAIETPTQEDVKDVMEKVLALDKAYPLPLLGTMLEKFPEKFEPAVWWPSNQVQKKNKGKQCNTPRDNNGWSEELEMEMREIIQVVKRKDIEDYVRLGNLKLKINKVLAISGPLLTGIAAIGSAFVGNGSCAAIVAVAAGALASVVNSFEHGGQVGMVIEMYRNCGGFFQLMEESIKATLEERDLEKRENGELFEMKVALKLGRSLSQLRELARKSSTSSHVDEFASKLF
uniref:F-box protein n=1 Tax=Fagus sylvatica TaxID=28930 RepID=A0A2N9ESX1_FAGSY